MILCSRLQPLLTDEQNYLTKLTNNKITVKYNNLISAEPIVIIINNLFWTQCIDIFISFCSTFEFFFCTPTSALTVYIAWLIQRINSFKALQFFCRWIDATAFNSFYYRQAQMNVNKLLLFMDLLYNYRFFRTALSIFDWHTLTCLFQIYFII